MTVAGIERESVSVISIRLVDPGGAAVPGGTSWPIPNAADPARELLAELEALTSR